MTISKVLEEYLIETIVKVKGGYKIRLESGKMQKKVYKTKAAAAKRILGMKSKGGFYNRPPAKQKQMIRNYLGKHKIK